MKKIETLIIITLICQYGFSQTVNTEAFSDFINDSNFPAFNKEMIINIKGDSIAGYAFIASGEKPKETVIMIHGLPGNDNQFDIAQSLRRTDRNVIHFNYRGSWESQGYFLYSNCLEDVNEVIEYLSNAENSKKLRINSNAFAILGRAFSQAIAAAAFEGVDSTPMEGFDPAALDEILGLKDKGLRSCVILALGYRDAEKDWLVNLKKVRKSKKDLVTKIS